MLMRVWLCIGIVHLVIPEVISQYFARSSSPLQPAFQHFEAIVEDGCSIDVLPDTIDWCDGKLTDKGKLPDNTVCQSIYADNTYLVCRYGRWITPKNGRSRRALNEAYKTRYNRTCSRFCTEDSGFYGKSVPFYSFCPTSVTLYPEYNPEGNETDNGTEVQYTWETPQAADLDGNVTTLEQIVGPEPNTTFNGTFSPGTNYIISYLATDNDNINWTCSFTVTVEIPNCPPIVHIKNGNSKCNDSNFRYSECLFTCNDGYRLNGTQTTTCQENGNWSYADDVPQCLVASCDDPVLINDTNIDVICENSTDNSTEVVAQFGSLCWLQCASTYLIRNDELQADILQNLDNLRQSAQQAHDLSLYDAEAARNHSNNAADLADTLEIQAITAENNTIAVNSTLQTAIGELNNFIKIMNETQHLLAQMQLQYNSTLKNATNSTEIQELTKNVTALNESVQAAQAYVKNLTLRYDEAYAASVLAQKTAEEAVLNATTAETVAQEKENYITVTTAALKAADLNCFQAFTYANTGNNIIVSTYAICTADGVWKIPGNPYCDDIDPPGVKCLPVVTHILNSGQTSGKVTWNLPEVYDNSGSAILYNISGPVPNDTLRVGQYIAQYRSEDDEGNLSPVCTMAINVQVYICDDITSHLPKSTEATCDSFELGAKCNLTSTLKGTTTGTCKRNSTTGEMYWDFGNVDIRCAAGTFYSESVDICVKCANGTYTDTDGRTNCTVCPAGSTTLDIGSTECTALQCITPPAPANGMVDCDEDFSNTTDNSTGTTSTGVECTFTCDEGYVLPYKTESVYTCSEEGLWDSNVFPKRCIKAIGEKYAEYTFSLKYRTTNCQTADLDGFMYKWETILLKEIPDYASCMNGYICELGNMMANCSPSDRPNIVDVSFEVLVTCEGFPTSLPREAPCDLKKEVALYQSIKDSVEKGDVLHSVNVTLLQDWLTNVSVSLPTCIPGSVLIGAYCVGCTAGNFYAESLDVCYECGIKQYTNTDGRLDCTQCADGYSTFSTGSTECTATCQPGHYSSAGFVPCSICRTGTYQQNEQGKNCTACPPNTWTTIEGGNSSAACVEYDLYFDADAQDIYLTAVNSTVSVVFWMKYYYHTNVTLGLFNEDDDPVFQLEASEQPQFLDGWTNEPLDFTFELGTWSMFGFTYDTSSGNVTIYADGEQLLTLTLNVADIADKLKISMIGNTSLISGLSVSNRLVDVTEISRMYEDCSAQLPGAFYTQDDLASKRLPGMKYAASTCKVSNASIEADHCGIHKCQNGGRCEGNAVGYTCNCTDQFGGPFCEETLVHGNWSSWFYAAGCSATCGPGTQLAYRFCNNPPKSEYGNDCEGNRTQVVDCFLQNCTECKQPVIEGVTICELRDDHCTATCPPGYVLPRGQQKQVFQCGQTTNYNWTPFHRLPICTESRQPKSYSATLTFTFDNPVPCNIEANVTAILRNDTYDQRCINEIADCNFTLEVINCDGGVLRRKRQAQTQLVIVFNVPLISNVTFDLVKYYDTSDMTESIFEALTAISVLEQTIQDILNNSTQFIAVVDGVTYTVAGNDTAVRTDTHCYVGEVPVGAVCARCQKGTHANNGWCVYCDRGSYQADAGQTRCIACPNGETTDFVGARSPNECIVLPVVPEPTDITSIIIIVVAVVLGLIVVILVVVLARRFYLSSKDREKFDMEADRISLYTDFPDLAYNVYFKRREVLGFDESGYPIIGKTRFMNGPVKRKGEGQTVDLSPREPLYQDEQQTPFSYDPYAMWSEETFVSPYEYPTEDTFDFPKIEHAVRYRVPGRQHLQNTYPLSQFGYTGDPHVRCRKNLPLPANIPYPKKLPQLMHRKPEPVSFSELLKSQFGFKKLRKEDLEEGIPIDPKNIQQNGVPPLPIKKITGKKTKNKGRKMSAPAAVRLTRSAGPSPRSPRTKPRSAPVVKAGIILQTKLEDRSPRAASAFSPRSSSTDTSSPRRPATTLGRSPRVVEFDDDTPHPKPSRYVVPKNVTLPNNLPFPTKSALKVSLPDDHRPETALTTGRKSVTIREDANITRPSTVATSFRPSTAGSSLQETIIELPRPFSDAGSARDTIFAPYSARPKSTFSAFSDRPHPLPSEITEAYRPVSSIFRPTTPLEHPRPVMHGAVTIKRTAGHAMFFPPTHLSFQQHPPVEHSMRQMAPPPFLNRVKPDTTTVRDGPSPNRERPNLDDGNEELSVNSSFFLTEVPEPLSASRVSLAGSVMSRGSKSSKKPSPPPDYSSSARDKIIESSSISHFGE